MGQDRNEKTESLTHLLAEDHRRLDVLLQSATSDPDKVEPVAYDQFRSGLLRHIGLEEKILLPTLQRLQNGVPISHATKLRLDHGALAVLLMPTPTPPILAAIRAILSAHNRLEEGPGGLYEAGDQVAASEANALIARLRAAPEVTVTPPSDRAAVMKTLRGALERAGYHLSDYGTAGEQKKGRPNENEVLT